MAWLWFCLTDWKVKITFISPNKIFHYVEKKLSENNKSYCISFFSNIYLTIYSKSVITTQRLNTNDRLIASSYILIISCSLYPSYGLAFSFWSLYMTRADMTIILDCFLSRWSIFSGTLQWSFWWINCEVRYTFENCDILSARLNLQDNIKHHFKIWFTGNAAHAANT